MFLLPPQVDETNQERASREGTSSSSSLCRPRASKFALGFYKFYLLFQVRKGELDVMACLLLRNPFRYPGLVPTTMPLLSIFILLLLTNHYFLGSQITFAAIETRLEAIFSCFTCCSTFLYSRHIANGQIIRSIVPLFKLNRYPFRKKIFEKLRICQRFLCMSQELEK